MREWHILVGKGRSPFGVEALTRVWMHGARHDEPINPEDILVEEFPEYENANLKAH